MSNRDRRRRLFFALWPDEVTRSALARLARGLPRRRGRPVPPDNLHITLAFAGAVDAEVRERLAIWAAAIETASFVLRLSCIGHFRRSRIVWLGAVACPQALERLAGLLNKGLETCALKPDLRPYRPHVTLLRDADPVLADIDVKPVEWPVKSFCLVESHTRPEGAQYTVLESFPLLAQA